MYGSRIDPWGNDPPVDGASTVGQALIAVGAHVFTNSTARSPALARALKRGISIAVLLGACAAPTLAAAANYVVTTSADSGAGSLRAAITSANGAAGADTITFTNTGAITLASALPAITESLSVAGTFGATIIDGASLYRGLVVIGPGTVTISNLTIRNTRAAGTVGGSGNVYGAGGGGGFGGGAGILLGGGSPSVTISGVTFQNAVAVGGAGGTCPGNGNLGGTGGNAGFPGSVGGSGGANGGPFATDGVLGGGGGGSGGGSSNGGNGVGGGGGGASPGTTPGTSTFLGGTGGVPGMWAGSGGGGGAAGAAVFAFTGAATVTNSGQLGGLSATAGLAGAIGGTDRCSVAGAAGSVGTVDLAAAPGATVTGSLISGSPLPPAPAPVPTLSEWAMILFGTLLAGGAALYIQRRQMV